MDGPATELSLLDWPSIWKLLERPRNPFEEKLAPLLLLKELSPESATPGINSASASKLPLKGKSATSFVLKLVVTCDVPVSISGVPPSTWIVSPTCPSSSLMVPRVESFTVPDIEPVAIPCEKPELVSKRQKTPTNNADHNCFRSIFFIVQTLPSKNREFANSFISCAPVKSS